MIQLKRTDIEDQLRRYRNKSFSSDKMITEVKAILNAETYYEKVEKTLYRGDADSENQFNIDFLETDRIYHIEQIKKICIDYRLRFLDTRYFKGTYPQEALDHIKLLEEQHAIKLQGFKIVAPSKLFKLKNADDPLLFTHIGNDYYYLIHKWGNDLHPLRKWLMLPFKNFLNLVIMIMLLSWVLTALMPMGLFSRESSNAHFWLLYLFMLKMVASVVLFYGFALGKNFNHAIWNSKYFNA